MTGVEVPLLSKPSLVSAALLVISTTIPAPDDRRAHLIREMVNLGWDDDDAVEFLALVAMPLDLLEETRLFLADAKKKYLPKRRQRFFRFANDMFHDHLLDQAVVAVRNGMLVAADSPRFVDFMSERCEYLRDEHGIDLALPLDDQQVLSARALLAVMDQPLAALDGALDYGIIKDRELALLTIEVGDQYPELIKRILERSTLDVDLLSSLMNASAPSVSDGVL